MPTSDLDWVLVKDEDTGSTYPIRRASLPHGNYTEVDDDALDYAGRPVAPVHAGEEPVVDGYAARTVPELRDLIADRNRDRAEADQIPAQGNKPDLIQALEADDTKES